MDIRSHISRFRNNQRKKLKENPLRWIGLTFALILSLSLAILVIVGVYRYSKITGNLPSPVMLENLLEAPSGSLLEPTKIYDKSGQTVLWRFENPAIEYRSNLRITDGNMLFFSDIPEIMVSAALIAIDPDYLSRSELFIENLWDNRLDPIPHTLVRDLLLWQEPDHPHYLLRTNLLADQIVEKYGRLKLLEWYLNSAYFGNQIYGIQQAAWIYFGKRADMLDTAESALLAAVMKFPALNPYDAPAAVKENQETILSELVSTGVLSQDAADRASHQELIYADHGSSISNTPPVYVEYILNEADEYVPQERLLRGGFKIISTINSELQNNLECTAAVSLSRIYGETPDLEDTCPASRLLPMYSGTRLSEQDNLEINLVLLDPKTGELLSLVEISHRDLSDTLFEPKLAGSLITPYIYINSFTQGFEPASLVWDVPLPDQELTIGELHPGCSDDCIYHGPVNIRTAMGNELLSPALQIWTSFGYKRINNTLALFGFSIIDESCPECVLFPGLSKVEIVDIAQGYGIFANQGNLRGRSVGEGSLESQPISVIRIEEIPTTGWFVTPSAIEKTIIGDQLAYLINHALSDEEARSNISGNDVFQIGRTVAIKTGFVSESQSGWVVGYTPQLVTVVWSGSQDQNAILSGADIQQINSGLWRAITQYTSRDYSSEDWQLPIGMTILEVCYPSGMLPSDYCPKVIREPFIDGNQPQEIDSLYQVLEVNRETDLLASVFTPSEKIEERVFLTIPDIAVDWSEETEIKRPPDIYDLESPEIMEDGFFISYPDNFSFIRGHANIIGSIPEEGFVSARMQFGEGINPRSWLQVGPDITLPVSNKTLAKWETEDLSDGIYALQLVLIRDGQQVDKVSVVVSVDNTPPDVNLVTDYSNQQITYQAGKELLFQVEFENNTEIQKVDLYIDSKLISSRVTPPYVFPWRLSLGDHDLRVVASDLANNRGETTSSFKVVLP